MRIDTRYIPADLIAGDKTLTGLLAELGKLEAAHEEAFRARDNATRELDTAPGSDSALYASALRAGRGDPGPVAVRTAEEKVTNAQRRLDAAEIASSQVGAEIADHVRNVAPKLREHATGQADTAREQISQALTALDTAMDRLETARHARRWVDAVAGDRTGVSAPSEPTLILTVPGSELGTTRADRITWHAVYDALCDLADSSRVATRETERSRAMMPGVPQMLSEYEMIHGRGTAPDDTPVTSDKVAPAVSAPR
ncbi:MAG: hypothetical protein ACR2FF_04355 [Mycobacteriales bacterium]